MTFATYYDSNDAGLGGLANTAGSLVSFLDKVLDNGYNAQTLTSLTAVGTLVTATLVSHGYRDRQFVTISGATPAAYNGTWQIIVGSTSTNTFQFNVSSAPGSSATGTLSCIVAPLGWGIPFTGTNLRVYQPATGNRLFFRIDDTGTTSARFLGYEAMTDVNTGTNGFPTAAQVASGSFFSKASAAGPRRTIAWGNGSVLYVYADYTGDSSAGTLSMIGDFTPYKSGDAWPTMTMGNSAAGTAEGSQAIAPTQASSSFIAIVNHYVARSATQLAGAVTAGKIGDQRFTASGATAGAQQLGGAGYSMTYPAPVDGNLWASQITVIESVLAAPRGVLQGIYAPMHVRPLSHLTISQGAGALAGKEIMSINLGTTGQILAEVSNTF